MADERTAEIVWGIIGCGAVTERKSGPAFNRVEGSRLAAVMRRDGAKAADYAERHGVPRWYDDVDALLADEEINAVYVATPTSSHCALTLKALASGRPVLVEKPISLDASEADRMIRAAEDHGLPLFVAFYRRTLPRFEALRELIQSGRLGPIRCVDIRQARPGSHHPAQAWKVDPAVNGGGLFVDSHIHVLDWLDHCFGPPTTARSLVRRLGNGTAEDLVSYQLGWDDGPVASGLCCFDGGPSEEYVQITGRLGSARMPFLSDAPIAITWNEGASERIELPDPPHVHEPMVARIVEQLRGGRRAPADAVAGARATRLIDTLYADYRKASSGA